MELNVNFNLVENKKKIRYAYVSAIIILLLIGAYLSYNVNNTKEILRLFYILLAVGLGYSYERLFLRKPCVLINSELISIKSNVFNKGQFIGWNDIKSIDCYFTSEYKIRKTDETIMAIDVSKFDYTLMCDIKNTIGHIAKGKNIQTNF